MEPFQKKLAAMNANKEAKIIRAELDEVRGITSIDISAQDVSELSQLEPVADSSDLISGCHDLGVEWVARKNLCLEPFQTREHVFDDVSSSFVHHLYLIHHFWTSTS